MPLEKQFDKKEVLEKAMLSFWESGYDGTPIAELLQKMGIQKGSFYATFGSKHEVLVAAIEKYIEDRFAQLEKMHQQPSALQALKEHFNHVTHDAIKNSNNNGCLVANMAVELAPKDELVQAIVRKTFEKHIGIYRRLLDRAVAAGELPESFDSLHVSRGLLAMMIGIRVLSRAGMPESMLNSIRDQALFLLQ